MHTLRNAGSILLASCALLAGGMIACSPDGSAVTAPVTVAATRNAQLPNGSFAMVAQALATAMQDSTVRHDVLKAMRASVLDNHKIDLQTYLGTASGQHLIAVATTGRGLSEASITTAVRLLPATDFYMPLRRHRQTWRGEAGILVAAIADKHAPVTGVALMAQRYRSLEQC